MVDRAGDSGIFCHANVGGRRALYNEEGTIEFWWKPNFTLADSGPHPILFVSPGKNWRGLHISVDYSKDVLLAEFHDPDMTRTAIVTSASSLVDGWNHISYVWENVGTKSNTRLYVNGKKQGWATGTPIRWEDDVYIFLGNLQDIPGRDCDASWDYLALYDKAMHSGNTYEMPTAEIPEPAVLITLIGFGAVSALDRSRRRTRPKPALL